VEVSNWTDERRPTEMNQEVMNEDDIHDFGIDVVAEYSKKDGFEILSINKDRKYNPQIVAKKNGQLALIVVRTARYPNKGSLGDSVR
jgi:methanogenic corrinoid protein MtbC1